MYKKIVVTILSLLSTPVVASDYQVAYSKNEDLRVLADNADETTWCRDHVTFSFQAGPNATEDSLAALFPKIGTLLNAACPQAEVLSWVYRDTTQRVTMSGMSSKATDWAFNVAGLPQNNVSDTLPKETQQASTVTENAASEAEVRSPESEVSPTVEVPSTPPVPVVSTKKPVSESRARLIREAKMELAQYQELLNKPLKSPMAVQKHVYQNMSIDQVMDSLLDPQEVFFSSIVEVSGEKDGKAQIVWPYEMRVSSPLSKGWYWIRGMQQFVKGELDSKGLPLTNIELLEDIGAYACQKEFCADLQEPEMMMRASLGRKDWTALEAEKISKEANN